jgi:hypothetical protein
VDSVITAYTARLKERTKHHLGCVCANRLAAANCSAARLGVTVERCRSRPAGVATAGRRGRARAAAALRAAVAGRALSQCADLLALFAPASYPYNLDFDFGPLEGLLKCVRTAPHRTACPPSTRAAPLRFPAHKP